MVSSAATARSVIAVAPHKTRNSNPDVVPRCDRSKWMSTRSPACSTFAAMVQLPRLAKLADEVLVPTALQTMAGPGAVSPPDDPEAGKRYHASRASPGCGIAPERNWMVAPVNV